MNRLELIVGEVRTAGITAGAFGALCVATAVYVGWSQRRFARYTRDARFTRRTRHIPYTRR